MGRTERELDGLYDVLGNERRRIVIRALVDEPETDKGALADVVAERTGTGRTSALVGLHQCHLPKMNGADVVVYDERSGEVRAGDNFELALSVIRHVDGHGGRRASLVQRLLRWKVGLWGGIGATA